MSRRALPPDHHQKRTRHNQRAERPHARHRGRDADQRRAPSTYDDESIDLPREQRRRLDPNHPSPAEPRRLPRAPHSDDGLIDLPPDQRPPWLRPGPSDRLQPTGDPRTDGLDNPIMSSHKAKSTSYFPHNDRMEGGYTDRMGKQLQTLQAYLAGKAPWVSIAMDHRAGIKYGQLVRIPELEAKYGMPIPFRVVDTGGAFRGRGFARVDICTARRADTHESTINGRVTLQFIEESDAHRKQALSHVRKGR